MTIVVVYVHPFGWRDQAIRFLQSYNQHPPGMGHETVVVCNGTPPDDEAYSLFGSLPNLTLVAHDNSGQDIGAFQYISLTIPCDLMLFFGAHAYFRGANWLLRVKQAFEHHGDHLFGAAGHTGVGTIWPHIRTTGFWCRPELLNEYPVRIAHASQRYEFEHGETGLTSWITRTKGRRALVVGWEGEADVAVATTLQNGYHMGDQRNLLFGDRMTCPPFHHCE